MNLAATAAERLGIPHLRPGIEPAARAATDGKDVLAIMPTGYGKSTIYQLAALADGGLTVIVSPLLALQDDQARHIQMERLGSAVELNSKLGEQERSSVLERLASGKIRFVFLAPEQLGREDTLEALGNARVTHFVVDEAHCISAWGHDFRPDYLHLGDVVTSLGHPPVVALTATAAPPVRAEIVEQLGMQDPAIIVEGFDRPNIHLEAHVFTDAAEKDEALLSHALVLATGNRQGLIYAATRRRAEVLAEELNRGPVTAAPYHAGLSVKRRQAVQSGFLAGDVQIVVATTAFGMGIDKPDVRFVLHADVAESLDAYYQEIGRAGRDGEPADAALFYRREDLSLPRFFGAASALKASEVEKVTSKLSEEHSILSVESIPETVKMSKRKVTKVLNALQDAGGLTINAAGEVTVDESAIGEATEKVIASEQARASLDRSRIEMVRGYAESKECRRRMLLTYFGQCYDHCCEACDNCEAGTASVRSEPDDRRYRQGTAVRHQEWGTGQIVDGDGDVLTVLFSEVGYKTISLQLAGDDILVPVDS